MCGFVGMVADSEVAPSLYLALQAIQHRGQDAAGLGVRDGGRLGMVKDLGLISQAIPPDTLPRLSGRAGVAHVRYPTAGTAPTREDAQPFITRQLGILLAHNGNLTNVPELVEDLARRGLHVLSGCDAEPLLLTLTDELSRIRPADHRAEDLVTAVAGVFRRARGAYSVVAVMQLDGVDTLIAFRDPHGIRPGIYGTDGEGRWAVASESVALDVLGFRTLGELPVGAVMLLRAGRAPEVLPVVEPRPRPCVFERIYFARPDSVMAEGRVNRTRWRLGRALAQQWSAKGHEADIVVAVPDTSRPAAMAIAEELGIPNREGFIKNRYSGRTFIMPDQATRDAALRLKLNPIREFFEGNRVLLIDDSIVRGSTMRRILRMVRALNPVELHVAIFAPPVRHPCFYGIDMPTRAEFAAAPLDPETLEEVLAEQLGADSLTFLSLEAVRAVVGAPLCDACFSGDYVVPVSEDERARICADRRGPATPG